MEMLQAAEIDCVPANAEIDATVRDAAHDVRADMLFQADAHALVLPQENADVFRQELGDRRHAGEDADVSLHAL